MYIHVVRTGAMSFCPWFLDAQWGLEGDAEGSFPSLFSGLTL